MRFSFTSPMPCGFALNHGREGDAPVVDALRFVSSEDGVLLVSWLDAISGTGDMPAKRARTSHDHARARKAGQEQAARRLSLVQPKGEHV